MMPIYPAIVTPREQHSERDRAKATQHLPTMLETPVSFGDVGLDRETANLTVRYSSVWPGAVLGRPRVAQDQSSWATVMQRC